MPGRSMNMELLLGRLVLAPDGRRAGRIEEIRAEQQGEDLVVVEYHIGAYAALERLSAFRIGSALLNLFRLRKRNGGYRVPWDRLDFSDVRRPRLTCAVDELAPLNRD